MMTVEGLKLRVKSLICHSRENGNPVLYGFPLLRARHLDSCLRRKDKKLVSRLFTHSPIHPFTNRTGFTLIETVIVMVIAVILAAVVAVRWSPFDTIKLNSATRKVAADIRYAQKLAISSQQRCGVVFSGSTYTVFEKGDTADPAPSSGDTCSTDASNNFVVDFNAGRCSNYSDVTVSTITLYFNSLGTPVDATGTAIVGNQTVTVTYKGTKQVIIYESTGRVNY